ncbi:MAG: hypothetical protein J6X28_01815 [Bacilli bacterium]|nr:hypothetical protein [Bacilli bacterium]
MAVEAYIDYERMIDLVDTVQEKADRINIIFDTEILQNRVKEIREFYSGEAATSYETEIKTVTKKVQEDIQKLVTDLRTEATRQKEAWESQDSKLA